MPCASKPLEKRENETRCKRNWMMASRQHFLHSWKLTEKIKDPFFLTLLERKKDEWRLFYIWKKRRARTGARTPLGRKSVEEWRKRIPCLFPCYHRIMSQRVNTLFLLVRTFICPSVIISFWAVVFWAARILSRAQREGRHLSLQSKKLGAMALMFFIIFWQCLHHSLVTSFATSAPLEWKKGEEKMS